MADGRVVIDVVLDDGRAVKGIANVGKSLGNLGKVTQRGVAAVGKLAGALGLVGLAYKGIDMVKNSLDGAIDRYDTLNNFPRVMAQIGFDAEDSQKAINKLSDGIQGLPTRLDEVASTAQRIAVMTGDLDGAVDTTLALNNAFLASGASAQDAQRGLEQYVQMLSKGEVDLQSWRTLQETMPYALRKTAEAFGFTGERATLDFYEALKSGEITMEEFNAKLIELDQAQGGFAETALTASGGIKTAWTNMKTWIVTGVAGVIAAIDNALGGVGSIEGAINGLRPIIEGFFGWIANNIPIAINVILTVADAAKSFYDTIQPWLPLLGAIAAAVVSFIVTLSTFNSVVGIVQGAIATFKSLRNVIMAVNTAFLANPIGIIIASIAALVAAGYVLIKNWDSIKAKVLDVFPSMEPVFNFFEQAFQRAKDGITRAIDALKMAWEGLKPVVITLAQILGVFLVHAMGIALGVFNGLANAIGPVISLFSNLLSFITNFVASLVLLFRGDLTGAIEHWKNAGIASVQVFIDAFEAIITFIAGFVETIVGFFKGLYNTLVGNSIIPDLVNGIIKWFQNLLTSAINLVKNIVNSVINWFKNLFNNTKNIFNSLRSTIQNIWNSIKNTITNVVSGIRNTISNIFNSIRNTVTNIVNGIKNTISNVFNSLRGITSNAFSKVSSAVRTGINNAYNAVKNKIKDFYNAGRNIVTSIADGIKSAIGKVTSAISGVAKKIRDFLPFSPAKEGPLRDIMNVKIAESIAEAIRRGRNSAVKEMEKLASELFETAQPKLAGIRGYTPNVALAGYIPNTVQVTQQLIESTRHRQQQQPIIKLEVGDVIMDGRKVGEIVWRPVKENIDRDSRIIESFRG